MYVIVYYLSIDGNGIASAGCVRMQLDQLPNWLNDKPGTAVTRINVT